MSKTLQKIIENGVKKDTRYCMTIQDAWDLVAVARNVGTADALARAFDFGYMQGAKAEKAAQKRAVSA